MIMSFMRTFAERQAQTVPQTQTVPHTERFNRMQPCFRNGLPCTHQEVEVC